MFWQYTVDFYCEISGWELVNKLFCFVWGLGIVCLSSVLMGLIFALQSFCEMTAVAYLYGLLGKWLRHPWGMLGHKICLHHEIFLQSCLQANFPVLETLPFPSWVSIIIILLVGLPCLCIPGYALCKLSQTYCCKTTITEHELNTVSVCLYDKWTKS